MELYDSPVLLILNATPSVMASELPIRVFETEIDIVDGMVCMHVLHFFLASYSPLVTRGK